MLLNRDLSKQELTIILNGDGMILSI